ncbi:MAG: hypothetical protein WCM76_08340 [Bacteroidota bacterium]
MFTLSSVTKQQWAAIAFSVLGIVASVIPWAEMPIGLHSTASCSGLHFFVGWIAFLCYIAIIFLHLFRRAAAIEDATATTLSKVCSLGTGLFTLLFIVVHIGDSFLAGPFISLLASAGAITFSLEFVKLK